LKKLVVSIILILSALAAPLTGALAAPLFYDVPETVWYYDSVAFAVERGLIDGRGNGSFDPNGTLTLSEAAALAGRLNPDYKPPEPQNGDAPASRAQFAEYVYSAMGKDKLKAINEIADFAIRDVARDAQYADAVYALYRAGVLTGSDEFGRFFPARTLTRAEACVLARRALEPASRRYTSLPEKISAEDIFTLSISSAFTIETYDGNGKFIRSGSGFFISPDGLAATCFHVLTGAYSAEITISGGGKHKVLGVAAYNAETNAALLRIEGSGFNWLPIADSDGVKTGATAYSLGSPLGLDGTISEGVISYAGREVEGQDMLQFTSNISQGSGGGALLDVTGRVIGITSSSYTAGETLNLAVMSNHITSLRAGGTTPLGAIARAA
jgi:S1-C subfamily serine protease